jgi:hypothetical protein
MQIDESTDDAVLSVLLAYAKYTACINFCLLILSVSLTRTRLKKALLGNNVLIFTQMTHDAAAATVSIIVKLLP